MAKLTHGILAGPLLLLGACPTPTARLNPEHCWNTFGDATCQSASDGARPFCTHDAPPCNALTELGCVSERPVLDECYSPCGGGSSVLENDACPGIASESTTDSEESETLDSSESESTSTDTSETDSSDSESSESGGCEAPCCTNHFQCPGDAGCHLELEVCLPPDTVYEVKENGTSLAEAFALLDGQDGTIRVLDGSYHDLASPLILAPNQVVAVVAVGPLRPTIERLETPNGSAFAFELHSGYLYLWGVDLVGDAGVRVFDAGWLHAEKCMFDVGDLAVYSPGGYAKISNCMLVSDNLAWPTIFVDTGGSVDVRFSTALARSGDNALVCLAADASVSNSILGSLSADNGVFAAETCEYSIAYSAMESLFASDPDDLLEVDTTTWLVGDFSALDFTNVDAGDLHLADLASDVESVALWSSDDPVDDFDGDLRITDSLTWPGADHP